MDHCLTKMSGLRTNRIGKKQREKRKNYENYQKITELQKQQINIKDRKVNRRKAQKDAFRIDYLKEWKKKNNK